MIKNVFRKGLVIGIIILFIGASVIPSISGTISKISDLEDDKKFLNEGISSSGQILSSLLTAGGEDSSSMSFHTFDKTGEKQCNVVLPTDAANDIYDMLEELKHKIVYEPRSDETKALKNEFVEMLDAYGLIPKGLSKSDVLSLLNPSWLNNKQKTPMARTRAPLLKIFVSRILRNIINLQQIFKNRFGKRVLKNFDKHTLISPSYPDTGMVAMASFCSIASGGVGIPLPLFMLPRPRGIAMWSASSAITLVSHLFMPISFLAEGAQKGMIIGFMGIGLTWASPGYTTYGFVGNALYTLVSADYIEFFVPNQEPVISQNIGLEESAYLDGSIDIF